MLRELLFHPIFVALVATWLVASLTKWVVAKAQGRKTTLADEFLVTGGMPSSHSALVSTLTVGVFIEEGPSALFFACLVFSAIVIRDSVGVRRSVGEQAQALNRLLKKGKMQAKVDVVLGHTTLQAIAGILLGTALAVLTRLWLL
jgi:acid phosphatase family membrane protein YuiD